MIAFWTTCKDFQIKYKLQVPYLQYFGVIACISKLRKSIKNIKNKRITAQLLKYQLRYFMKL